MCMLYQTESIACPLCEATQADFLIQTPVQMQRAPGLFQFVSCSNCRLVYLNPRVKASGLGYFYPESYLPYRGAEAWGRYARLVQWGLDGMDARRVKSVRKKLAISPQTRVLDYGCGRPTFLYKLQQKTQCQAYGLDFSSQGWEGDARFESLHLQVGGLEQLEPHLPFDLITMWHYLEHDYHPRKTLSALRAKAHPNTHLVIEVPNYDSWFRKRQGAKWGGYHTPRHTMLFSPQTLARLLRDQGWEPHVIQTYGTMDPFLVWWLSTMEKQPEDWTLELEKHFWGMVFQKFLRSPFFLLQRSISMGIMWVLAKPKKTDMPGS